MRRSVCFLTPLIACAMLAVAPAALAAHHSPFILGVAAVAKGEPIVGGRISAETLAGQPLAIRWGAHTERRKTRARGVFAIPTAGLPARFVIVIRGGRVLGAGTRAVFRAAYPIGPARFATAAVTLGTTLEVTAFRHPWSSTSGGLKAARAAVRRSLRFPNLTTLGLDDRVNPQIVSATRVRRLARTSGGMAALLRDLRRIVAARAVIAQPGLGRAAGAQSRARVSARVWINGPGAKPLSPTKIPPIVENPSNLGLSFIGQVLSLAGHAVSYSETQAITSELADLQTGVSQIQVSLQSDYLGLIAANSLTNYNIAANAAQPLTANLQTGVDDLNTIWNYASVTADTTAVAAASANLKALMSSTAAGGLANPATATLLQQQTVATGAAGLGTLPAAWQAIRAQQLTGQLGSTTTTTANGTTVTDAALGQGTTLYTNEMSTAFTAASDYWYTQMFTLAVLVSNYWNYVYTQDPPPAPTTAQQATVNQLGGVCPQGQPCPGTIAYYLQQQAFDTPMTVPTGTVIDPTMNLIWTTALFTPIAGSNGVNPQSSDTGLPVDPATGNTVLQELPGQLNAAATTPWSGVNPNLLAAVDDVAQSPPNFSFNWGFPTVNFAWGQTTPNGAPGATCTHTSNCMRVLDPAQSPQFGIPGSGSGLLGGIQLPGDGQLQLMNITGLTSPSAFPNQASGSNQVGAVQPTANWWWQYGSNGYWCQQPVGFEGCQGEAANYYPAGVMTFGNNQYSHNNGYSGWIYFTEQPVIVAPALTGAVLVQSPIPGGQFQYPASYPASVLANPAQLVNLIYAYRTAQS